MNVTDAAVTGCGSGVVAVAFGPLFNAVPAANGIFVALKSDWFVEATIPS